MHFSTVLYMVALHSKTTRALMFENVCQWQAAACGAAVTSNSRGGNHAHAGGGAAISLSTLLACAGHWGTLAARGSAADAGAGRVDGEGRRGSGAGSRGARGAGAKAIGGKHFSKVLYIVTLYSKYTH
jgi:hypothetical protein